MKEEEILKVIDAWIKELPETDQGTFTVYNDGKLAAFSQFAMLLTEAKAERLKTEIRDLEAEVQKLVRYQQGLINTAALALASEVFMS